MLNEKVPDTAVMVFSGEYDLASKEQVQAAFDAVSEAPRAVLDFSDVTYIDSTVVHELLRIHNTRAARDLEREVLVMHNDSLFRIFHVLNLTSVFRIVHSIDEAVGKNGEQMSVQYASSFDGSAGTNGFSNSVTSLQRPRTRKRSNAVDGHYVATANSLPNSAFRPSSTSFTDMDANLSSTRPPRGSPRPSR